MVAYRVATLWVSPFDLPGVLMTIQQYNLDVSEDTLVPALYIHDVWSLWILLNYCRWAGIHGRIMVIPHNGHNSIVEF